MIQKNTFSSIPHNILHIEDVRVFTHCNIEEIGSAQILNLYTKQMADEVGNLKPEFKVMEEKGFA